MNIEGRKQGSVLLGNLLTGDRSDSAVTPDIEQLYRHLVPGGTLNSERNMELWVRYLRKLLELHGYNGVEGGELPIGQWLHPSIEVVLQDKTVPPNYLTNGDALLRYLYLMTWHCPQVGFVPKEPCPGDLYTVDGFQNLSSVGAFTIGVSPSRKISVFADLI